MVAALDREEVVTMIVGRGLLIRGQRVPVPGLSIIGPGDAPWCRLDPGDYSMRALSAWVRAVVVHTTKGIWPQRVIPGSGRPGHAQAVADFWRGDPTHSAAHIVIDTDGTVACLCDLATTCAYHATVSNDWSVGIEMYQASDGGIYEATLLAATALIPALCNAFGFAFQIPRLPYTGHPLKRLLDGGPDVVGVYGHRDNTEQRGAGDPGDEIFRRLSDLGAERFDLEAGEDLRTWKRRQILLNSSGEKLVVDGVAGPSTLAAMRRQGYGSPMSMPV